MIALYFDEDSSDQVVVNALRSRHVDVLTAVDAARTGKPDAEQLGFAMANGRAIVTANVGNVTSRAAA